MKWILLSACGCLLLFTTGCLTSSEEWHGHERNARFALLGPSPVAVHAPAVAAHPPKTTVR